MDYTPFSELDNISASAYARLLLYRQMCSEVATALCYTFRWIDITDRYVWIDCPSCEKDSSTKRFMFHSQVPVRCWWVQSMNRSAKLLQNRPSGKVISSQGWYQQALKEAAACPICIARAVDELPVFAKKFADKVDEVVAEVQLELK
ncbi:uncharacterized protein LAESUDRAFT_733137 [Laetiporus sulphureus 93-53]|uniref:Uncharacterized protein n=1 Tax=Laetiporus sulphureus 93-53 TaxID=1314785 RepID=A0A165ANI8_9APHY|nr:uncharacterized protein LAESUDRAFT_733137 [Laetiporus sulphureus 93-53]KZS99350.1 hypothetical protein LAESUDRAFT_733137 [Laetiporus sulphureus 93-53]